MNLSEHIKKLQALEEQGHGELPVLYADGTGYLPLFFNPCVAFRDEEGEIRSVYEGETPNVIITN